ncbi:hypothetical protein ACLB2K_005904 [Fragaria x ananassa]
MNILVWNCQGIVNRRTRHALKMLIQKHQVNMVFLSETHCTESQHQSLQRALGFPNSMIELKEQGAWLCSGMIQFKSQSEIPISSSLMSMSRDWKIVNGGLRVSMGIQIHEIYSDHCEEGLFARQEPNIEAHNAVLRTIQPRVTAEMNQALLNPYTVEEVKEALFQMHPSKASGPDGMSPFFYQKYWDLVDVQVSNAVISFLSTKDMPHDLNFTHVVLIPKEKEVQNMTQLRPIALCNVIYKIASKVLANRLKSFLSSIISPEHGAFVPNRLIADNTFVASELAHYMNKLCRCQEGFMALKLDISKAYDRLEWDFLKKILLKFGFDPSWVDLIMHCLSTVRYSFLVNGAPRGYVTPHRGLRQGDPIFPYLFLLCAEGLSALIADSMAKKQWQGLKVCDGAPEISHLLFANDSMLYASATQHNCEVNQVIREILNLYEDASVQQVNLEKSSVVFSGNVAYSA